MPHTPWSHFSVLLHYDLDWSCIGWAITWKDEDEETVSVFVGPELNRLAETEVLDIALDKANELYLAHGIQAALPFD